MKFICANCGLPRHEHWTPGDDPVRCRDFKPVEEPAEIDRLQAEIDRKREELDVLEREIRNAKARRRRVVNQGRH